MIYVEFMSNYSIFTSAEKHFHRHVDCKCSCDISQFLNGKWSVSHLLSQLLSPSFTQSVN